MDGPIARLVLAATSGTDLLYLHEGAAKKSCNIALTHRFREDPSQGGENERNTHGASVGKWWWLAHIPMVYHFLVGLGLIPIC